MLSRTDIPLAVLFLPLCLLAFPLCVLADENPLNSFIELETEIPNELFGTTISADPNGEVVFIGAPGHNRFENEVATSDNIGGYAGFMSVTADTFISLEGEAPTTEALAPGREQLHFIQGPNGATAAVVVPVPTQNITYVVDLTLSENLGSLITTVQGVGMGSDATMLGDLDGDGYTDFALTDSSGMVHIHSHVAGELMTLNSDRIGANDGFGSSIASGDIDGDGKLDLLVGAPLSETVIIQETITPKEPTAGEGNSGDGSGEEEEFEITITETRKPGAGRIDLFLDIDPMNGTYSATSVEGLVENEGIGKDIHLYPADLDNDGMFEILDSDATKNNNNGEVKIISSGSALPLVTINGSNGEELQYAAQASDYNGDGIPELLFGHPGYAGNRGAASMRDGASGNQLAFVESPLTTPNRFGVAMAESKYLTSSNEAIWIGTADSEIVFLLLTGQYQAPPPGSGSLGGDEGEGPGTGPNVLSGVQITSKKKGKKIAIESNPLVPAPEGDDSCYDYLIISNDQKLGGPVSTHPNPKMNEVRCELPVKLKIAGKKRSKKAKKARSGDNKNATYVASGWRCPNSGPGIEFTSPEGSLVEQPMKKVVKAAKKACKASARKKK